VSGCGRGEHLDAMLNNCLHFQGRRPLTFSLMGLRRKLRSWTLAKEGQHRVKSLSLLVMISLLAAFRALTKFARSRTCPPVNYFAKSCQRSG